MALAAGALLAGGLAAFGASAASANTPPEGPGPWYVNPVSGNDANSCLSPTQACKTIKQALIDEGTGNNINSSPPATAAQDTIYVSAGVDPEACPINVAADNNGVSIVGAGQSLKKKKVSTIIAPTGPCGGGGLININTTGVTISNLVVSGGNASGQTTGIVAGPFTTITKVTVLSGAAIGIAIEGVTAAVSSSTIGSATSCSTTATESSSGDIITVAKIPKCAKGFTAVTVGDAHVPNHAAAFELNKTEIQTAGNLVVDNGATIYFNTSSYGYSSVGILCAGATADCDITDSDIIGGGTYLAGAVGIVVEGGAAAEILGNTITGNADSTAPVSPAQAHGVGIAIEPGAGTNVVQVGDNTVKTDGNTLGGNDSAIVVEGQALASSQVVNIIGNKVTSGSANKGGGVVVAGAAAGSNVGSVTIQDNTIGLGATAPGAGVVLEAADGILVGGTTAQGNTVSGNGLGINVTSAACITAEGSHTNTITGNTVTNNTLFGILVDGVASLPELFGGKACATDVNTGNTITSNVVTGNGLLGNAEGVYGADIIDFGLFQAPTFPAASYTFNIASGTPVAGCTGETPCSWSVSAFDTGAASPGEKVPEGTAFLIGTDCATTAQNCITAFTATTPSGFQTISNNALAPSPLELTGEAGALSSLTTPFVGDGAATTYTNNDVTTAADGNTITGDVCTNGLGAPTDQVPNTLTSNKESGSQVLNVATATAAYDAC
jgi:parallel beta-helix repeat protein